MSDELIRIRGARQNNLKNINLDLPLGELIVITGVSGSGKSSLAFDTVFAEGQRRYVETFSPYARQFLDRMDRPKVDHIEGIPPAIAIDQTNPVRTSRSSVGTMTELNDHLKLLFARAARLFCPSCGAPVVRDDATSVLAALHQRHAEGVRLMVTFPVRVPESLPQADVEQLLHSQGYTRVHQRVGDKLEVVQDRTRLSAENRARLVEAIELAFRRGHGQSAIYPLDDQRRAGEAQNFSTGLHCAHCDIEFRDPIPSLFSFNSPLGACETCRGFGRVIGIDWSLVIPDEGKSLLDGAVKPFQTDSAWEYQEGLIGYARDRGVPVNTAWEDLTAEQRAWVIQGDTAKKGKRWRGVQRFFSYLESKAYKMHVRVLLSKYRSYDACPACDGARLKPEALNWRVGTKAEADAVLPADARFRPAHVSAEQTVWEAIPGLSIYDLMRLPIDRCLRFFDALVPGSDIDQAADLLFQEIRSRLRYLGEVGLSYLTLDRQSRTLSGGEVQRINLTTALGTSLVNTLFVLDEPSVGLHSRDIQRLIQVLKRLRDAGNTLLVVEHDPEVILAADRLIDIGPGPGTQGGNIVSLGPVQTVLNDSASRTAAFLSGKESAAGTRDPSPPDSDTHYLHLSGVSANNLQNIDVAVPLQRLVCVTGVSGSGKSTLVQDVLYNALRKLKGRPDHPVGNYQRLVGVELIDEVILVDQSPIGKTSRANPASYVGALEGIRKIFAKQPLSNERGYTAGTFSFNSGNGRCATCGGTGFEHVEMQFLADVYLRCPDCDGKRYRQTILQVKYQGLSISDVLNLTVNDAAAFFSATPEILQALEPLRAIGLGYLTLGQPVPTLSGGEAQRLKLAGRLVKKKRKDNNCLFIFDEPTTGLHFADIALLLRSFERLLRAGHSLLVIEHNLDVIAAADWIIDLGPEGGERGGRLVCAGSPQQVMLHPGSYTGRALQEYSEQLDELRAARCRPAMPDTVDRPAPTDRVAHIEIVNAREHNLKNLNALIPRDRFTVVTGVSGSGKSTLAFDILFNEGQRRYLESLNAYARQFVQPAARADVDAVYGMPPTVAIEQRTSRGGAKSTVGTMTEIHHYLRLLLVKLGTQYCPDCEIPIQPQSREEITARILRDWRGYTAIVLAPLVVARKGVYNELAKWASRKGYLLLRADGEYYAVNDWPGLDRYQEHNIDVPVGEVEVSKANAELLSELVDRALDQGKGTVRVADRETGEDESFSLHRACPGCGTSFEEPDPRLFSYNSKYGWCPTCFGTGTVLDSFDAEQTGEEETWLRSARADDSETEVCGTCAGSRLRAEALSVYFADWSIADYSACSVDQALAVFRDLHLDRREKSIGRDVIDEICARLEFLQEVGLGYLALDRSAPTLSGGEAQRIRLASQLGSNLRGVCYVLDEPTIGLHPRDNKMLLSTLRKLGDKGNTVVVVEHDEDTIRQAQHVIDLGPGAGTRGGRIVAQGTFAEILANSESPTGMAIAHPPRHPLDGGRRPYDDAECLVIHKARLNNLKGFDLNLPLQRLVCITGVSGSGKSTLLHGVLHSSVKALLAANGRNNRPTRPVPIRGCEALTGWEHIGRVLEVDQSPIGKTPRSCPATYVGFWDAIRKLFAATPEANLRGYGPGRFSFNSKGGRCDACDGQGFKRIEMSFLPDVKITCESCGGKRFNHETLEIQFKDKSIGDVLDMEIDDAVTFFGAHSRIHHALQLLQQVGLGYLTLGQPSPTLSGGESQRIKLVTELAKARPSTHPRQGNKPTLYLLDEPTVGLHLADVKRLIQVLHRLVDAGHSLVVIEHNLDVIAEADWVFDLGPEGGDHGGEIVTEGTPEDIAHAGARSQTGKALRPVLELRPGAITAPDS